MMNIQAAAVCSDSFDKKTGTVKINEIKQKLLEWVEPDENNSTKWAESFINDALKNAHDCCLFKFNDMNNTMTIIQGDTK